MHCPACGSPLKETTTAKGAKFLTCSKWPKCRVSGTPELLERLEQVSANATAIQGSAIAQKEAHTAAFEELRAANERRRKILDELFRCCGCNGWFPVAELQPASPDPEAAPVCNRCLNTQALRNQVVDLQQRETPVESIPDDPLPLGSFVTGLAQLRIHQAKLKRAKTAEERAKIKQQALEAMK